jgi:HK97 family phage portal protein
VDQDDAATLLAIESRSNLARIFEEIRDTRRTVAGVTVSPELALECAAVLAAVRVLSESIASLPLNLYRRLPNGGKEIADDQHLHEVLHFQPNDWMTAFEFKEWLMSQLLLWGSSYAYIKPGQSGGAVEQLIPLHASRMEVKRLKSNNPKSIGPLRYYYTQPPTLTEPNPEPLEYRQHEIFHIRWLSSDGVNSHVPVTLSREAIGLARATELHSSSWFGNGARGGTVIETDQPQKPEALQRFKEAWNDAHQGPDKAYKTLVLPYGFKKKPEESSNAVASLLDTRRFAVEEIARVYRVPPHLLGDLTNVRYNSVEQSAIDFVTFSLIPWCRRIEMAIRRDLVVDDKTYFAGFDVNALMAGDYEARSKFIREMWNMGALDIDEVRAEIGRNPLGGEDGKKRFVQVNMQLLGAFTKDNPTGQKPQNAPGAEQPKDPVVSVDDAEQPPAEKPPVEPAKRSGDDVVFRTNLRRLAGVEFDGIIERRNKPEKMALWIEQVGERMRAELRDAAEATGQDIDAFVVSWMNSSREILLSCQRSGQKYETVQSEWCDRHL